MLDRTLNERSGNSKVSVHSFDGLFKILNHNFEREASEENFIEVGLALDTSFTCLIYVTFMYVIQINNVLTMQTIILKSHLVRSSLFSHYFPTFVLNVEFVSVDAEFAIL